MAENEKIRNSEERFVHLGRGLVDALAIMGADRFSEAVETGFVDRVEQCLARISHGNTRVL